MEEKSKCLLKVCPTARYWDRIVHVRLSVPEDEKIVVFAGEVSAVIVGNELENMVVTFGKIINRRLSRIGIKYKIYFQV